MLIIEFIGGHVMANILGVKPLYILSGKIIYGRGIGKLVGTPTANLQIHSENDLPPTGVYVTEILLDSQIFYGVTNIGTRPTVDNDNDVSIETLIFNFNKNIYGKRMEIRLFKKLRCPQKFENLSMLLEQIRMDCIAAQEFFGIKQISSRLHMNIKKHQVKIDDKDIYLSTKEFDVLYMLYSNPDVIFTKEQIYEAVWHEPSVGYCHAVENTVFQIRQKCKEISENIDFIKTIVGYGYKFCLNEGTDA